MALPVTPGPVPPPLVLARMQLAFLRHALADAQRAAWLVAAAAIGVLLAAATVWAGFVASELLATLLVGWLLGWLLGPLLLGGGDNALRPEYFRSVGLSRWRLSAAMLAGSLVGIGPAVTLLALLTLLARGVTAGPAAVAVAIPVLLAQLLCLVLLSKLAVTLYGVLLQRRLGAVLAGVVTAFTLAFTAQGWALVTAFVSADAATTMADAARLAPSGWGLVAVEAAGRGAWGVVLLAVGALLAVCALAYAAWTLLLSRRTVGTQLRVRPRRQLRAHDAQSAALAQQLHAMSRDLLLTNRLVFALGYGLAFTLMPLAVGWAGMLPWAGPIFVVMAVMMWSNHYGIDGTRLWLLVAAPGAAALDVRARQQAFLVIVGPVAVVLTVVLTALAGSPAQWPYVAATLPALLAGGLGLASFFSVYAATPTTDPHKRPGNPLSTGADADETGTAYLVLLVALVSAAPSLLAVRLVGWWGVPVGIATGAVIWSLLTRAAVRRLESRGVELLNLLEHGRSIPTGDRAGLFPAVDLTPAESRRIALVGGLAAVPLFPQGVVAMILMSGSSTSRSWFLALHVPPPWGWLVATLMIMLGLLMYGYAWRTYLRARRRDLSAPTMINSGG